MNNRKVYGIIFSEYVQNRRIGKPNNLNVFLSNKPNGHHMDCQNLLRAHMLGGGEIMYIQINTWAFPYWPETKSRLILARANMGLDMEHWFFQVFSCDIAYKSENCILLCFITYLVQIKAFLYDQYDRK
jgi:hypothetical protein